MDSLYFGTTINTSVERSTAATALFPILGALAAQGWWSASVEDYGVLWLIQAEAGIDGAMFFYTHEGKLVAAQTWGWDDGAPTPDQVFMSCQVA
jgi:hypothetical protein